MLYQDIHYILLQYTVYIYMKVELFWYLYVIKVFVKLRVPISSLASWHGELCVTQLSRASTPTHWDSMSPMTKNCPEDAVYASWVQLSEASATNIGLSRLSHIGSFVGSYWIICWIILDDLLTHFFKLFPRQRALLCHQLSNHLQKRSETLAVECRNLPAKRRKPWFQDIKCSCIMSGSQLHPWKILEIPAQDTEK